MGEEEKYRKELDELRIEHDQLDKAIGNVAKSDTVDQLRIQRMKKRKLWIRDRIHVLEKFLYPDIIA